MTEQIFLSDINKVKEFVMEMSSFPYPINLKSGNYTVDARSILSIFSLDLTQPIELCANCESDDKLSSTLEKYRPIKS